MTVLDWIVFTTTLLGIVLYGVWRGRGQHDADAYILAGRSMPWYMVLLGVMATQASAITFLSAPGQAFTDGMRFVQYYFGLPIAMVVIAVTFIPIFRKQNVYTAYEYLENRFDRKTRLITSVLFLMSRGLSTGISIYAPSIIVSSILGWNIYFTNVLVGGLLLIYTLRGGARSIAYTQTVMFGIILSAMLVAAYLLVDTLPNGMSFGDALTLADLSGRLNIITTNFDLHDKYNLWSGIIGGFFLALSYFGTDQSQVGRFLTGKNVKESRIGLLVNGVVKIPMQFGILLIGALLVALYAVVPSPIFFNDVVANKVREREPAKVQQLERRWDDANSRLQSAAERILAEQPNVIPSAARNEEYQAAQQEVNTLRAEYRQLVKQQGITESNDTNYIFLHFVRTTLPAGLAGLLFAVVIMASWGSISAALHSLATASYVDLQPRKQGTGNGEQGTWHLAPGTWHLIWGVFCIAISMAATRMGSLIEAVNVLGSLFYGPILGIFLVAFYVKRAGGTAVFWGAVIAEAVVACFWWFDVVSFLWLNVVGAVVVIVVALLISRPMKQPFTPLLSVVLLCLCSVGMTAQRSMYVDTQIGSQGSGQVHPGVSVPYGLTNAAVYRITSNINNTLGISLLNIQGTGCQSGALGHVIVRGSDQADIRRDPSQSKWFGVNAAHSALLDISYGSVRHYATATPHGVMHRIVPNSPNRGGYIVIDVGEGYTHARNVSVINSTDSTIDVALDVGGFCTHPIYRRIYAHLDVKGAILTVHPDSTGVIVSGRRTANEVTVSVGLSLTSTTNAIRNHDVELAGNTFDDIVERARRAWDTALDRFQVSGGTRADSVVFYTALYRIMQHPSNAEDVTGDHVRFNSNVIERDDSYTRTIGHDIWGIFQTNMPFYALFLPEQWKNVIRTLVEMSVEIGETPQFDFLGKQIHIMGGDPFPMVVIDSYFNGSLPESELRRLLPILERASTTTGTIRPFTYLVDEYGYIPSDRDDGTHRHNSVANLLEYATADAANAVVSSEIGDMHRTFLFSMRAARIWNAFHGQSGWFRERTKSGEINTGLDVDSYDSDYAPATGGPGFKEGSAREFLFYPTHLRREIARRLGGWDAFAQRLDPLFDGSVREYSIHNQIQMHLPFQYLYVPDSAHRAHRLVREALRTGFDVKVDGLPGNDDLGSVSAWAALVMMGLYPTTGFEGTWLIVAPVFDTVVAGHLTIIRRGEQGPYVRSVQVDGRLVAQTHIDDAVLRNAREVVIETANEPQPQLRPWNRQQASVTWTGSTAVIQVDDDQRETPIEVKIGRYGTSDPIMIDTLEAGVDGLTITSAPDQFWWTLHDLGDPSGRLAVLRYSASRTHEAHAVPLVHPNPVYHDLYVADNNGLYPSKIVVTDLTGRSVELRTDTTPLVSTRHLTAGMYHLEASYPDGVVRTSTFLIIK